VYEHVSTASCSVPDRGAVRPLLGSLLFFVVAPGTVAGWVPYRLTGWRMGPSLLPGPGLRVAGAVLVIAGVASLVDSFLRFALVGRGTPAPIAPTRQLVVSGQYRHVRNPMYVAVVAIILGQGLLLGSTHVLLYAGIVWLITHTFVLLYEEPTLASQFGTSYETYRRNVRRWWPRIQPWRGPATEEEARS
jgi:protein-S-isoprenylcysteine O-methyltransferase Ste14